MICEPFFAVQNTSQPEQHHALFTSLEIKYVADNMCFGEQKHVVSDGVQKLVALRFLLLAI